ncbi:putative hemolysin [Acinetobacter larvae]|uniref:Hemolysin n=1 Tax=Acinetobacter larvae TaxID=1789224 RepID=A0A1B2LZT0_9GAMM|nr:DUF333 domain-containing protein [Acinetobacter larvae]AOA58442.1 hypothetical protein BFG52_08805 [Acinetobacter larvae]
MNILHSFALIAGAVLLSACQSQANRPTQSPLIGKANPASEYCIAQQGRLEIVQKTEGAIGLCHLTDGQVIEEWQLFRSAHTCQAEAAQLLIGQNNLSDAEIQQRTHAQQVRRTTPDGAVTSDYSAQRVTVTVDPKTQKIVHANCG